MGIYVSPGHIRHCYLTLSIGYSTFAFLTSALLQSSCFNQVASILNILDDELVRGVGNFILRLVSSGSSIFNFGTIPASASFFIHVLSNSFRLYLGFIFCLSYLLLLEQQSWCVACAILPNYEIILLPCLKLSNVHLQNFIWRLDCIRKNSWFLMDENKC